MTAIRIALILFLSLALSSCKEEGKEEILDVFDAYNAALNNNDGAAAIALIDDKYFEDFQHMLIAARSAKREQVFRMRPSERSRIATMRNRLSYEELKTLDARGAIKTLIDRGSERSSGLDITLGKIKFKRPRATAPLIVEGFETKHILEFVQADNVWKLDPACFDESLDFIIAKRSDRRGVREDTLILENESASSGKNVTDAIWDPPKQGF